MLSLCLGWPQTMILPLFTSQADGIISMSHHMFYSLFHHSTGKRNFPNILILTIMERERERERTKVLIPYIKVKDK
jgi:hypothetical protein